MKLRWFLKKPHSCNYCGEVNGVTFDAPRVKPRLVWMLCKCMRRHYVCQVCLKEIGNNGCPTLKVCARKYLRRKLMEQFKGWPYPFAWLFTKDGATVYRLPGCGKFTIPARALVLATEGCPLEGLPPDFDVKTFKALIDDFASKMREHPGSEWWSEAMRPVATEESDELADEMEGGLLG